MLYVQNSVQICQRREATRGEKKRKEKKQNKDCNRAKSRFPKTALYKLLEAMYLTASSYSLRIITLVLFMLSKNDQKRHRQNHNLAQTVLLYVGLSCPKIPAVAAALQ